MAVTVETFNTMADAASSMDGAATFIGGGTLIMGAVNYGDQNIRRLIRVSGTAHRAITQQAGRLDIGAGVTMADVIASHDVSFLAQVAQTIGGPAIRNMASVGGNLFARHPYGDFTTALLALDGKVSFSDGTDVALDAFLRDRDNHRALVVSVSIARPSSEADFKWHKVSRVKPRGVSVMSMAAWLPTSGGRISGARIAYGAMGPVPMRALKVEQALEGKTLDENGVGDALAVACDDVEPVTDALASSWYRREVAPVHLRRLLLGERSS